MTIDDQIKQALSPKYYDASTYSLIISNIIVIIIAVINKINILELMWLYIGQSLIIGFFTFCKILSLKKFSTEKFYINNKPVEATTKTKISTGFFFLIHYGGFHLVFAGFLGFFTYIGLQDATNYQIPWIFFLSGLGIFFINHLISFIYNYKKDANANKNIANVMLFPYLRILPFYFIMFFGAGLGGILLTFMILKTLADVAMHQIEHKL